LANTDDENVNAAIRKKKSEKRGLHLASAIILLKYNFSFTKYNKMDQNNNKILPLKIQKTYSMHLISG